MSLPLNTQDDEAEGFLELARLNWEACRSLGDPNRPNNTCDYPGLIELLAALLQAASNGQGSVSLSKLRGKEPLDEAFLRSIRQHPQLFILEQDEVLLPRYAELRQKIRDRFVGRISHKTFQFNARDVSEALDAIFPGKIEYHPDHSNKIIFDNGQQRLAIAALVDAKVGILTGGPGTGKTTTAAAILALLKRLRPEASSDDILVAAPTGKAARRIAGAIARAGRHLHDLSEEELTFLNTIEAQTLHKALEWSPVPPERGGPFGRNCHQPLKASFILVDEASMIDMTLMHALVEALPESANLLLLGDSDQLESVDVGGVLSELVRASINEPLPQKTVTELAARLSSTETEIRTTHRDGLPVFQTGPSPYQLAGLVFGLKYSRRAMHSPWILKLAEHVRPGTTQSIGSLTELIKGQPDELVWHREHVRHTRTSICKTIWTEWAEKAGEWIDLVNSEQADVLKIALNSLETFQLLCSTNRQVERANTEGLAILWGNHRPTKSGLPHGCPIIVQSNSRILSLSNGDVGIAVGKHRGDTALFGLFDSGEATPRLIPLTQMPLHRPAFGLTIHKSQGSEWEHVAIELPEATGSKILSKNLLYTAITRSSGRVTLFGEPSVLRELVEGTD